MLILALKNDLRGIHFYINLQLNEIVQVDYLLVILIFWLILILQILSVYVIQVEVSNNIKQINI